MLRSMWAIVGSMLLLLAPMGFASGQAEEGPVDIQIGIAPREVGDVFPDLLDEFQEENPQINVEWLEVPGVPNEQKSLYVTNLAGASSEPDVMALDVIWPGEFIANNWTMPLNDYFSEEELGEFNEAFLEAATVDGEVHAIPFYQNAIHFFYRQDLLDEYDLDVPTTWSELEEAAEVVLEGEDNPDLEGYASMWAQIEGLFMNYLQFLWSAGGTIVSDNGELVVDTPEAHQALEQMVGMLESGIAPESLLGYNPNDTMSLFRQGRAVFMVVQDFVWPIITEEDSPVADDVEMGSIPVFEGIDESTPRHATGGWMFAINPNTANPDEAAELVRFLTSEQSQLRLGIEAGALPPRVGMEENEELIESRPIAETQYENFAMGRVRPSIETGENYSEFSHIMQRHIHAALTGDSSVDEALASAQEEVNELLDQ